MRKSIANVRAENLQPQQTNRGNTMRNNLTTVRAYCIRPLFTAALVLALAFTLSCSGGDDGGGDGNTPDIASFGGAWSASDGRAIVFDGNTFSYKVNGSTEYSGTFSVSGSTITFNETLHYGGQSASGSFSLSENTLVLSNHTWDSSVNGTYTRDGGNSSSSTPSSSSGGGSTPTATYIITKSGTQYTATKNGATVATDVIIQPIIDEIKTNASSANIAIQFGNGTDVLDIGSSYIQFMNSASKTWGDITLLGKITSRNLTHGTIHISENISVTINGGTVSQTESSYSNCEAIYNSGTLNITGGTIQAGTGAGSTGISNRGTLNITGGTITATGNGSKGIINTTATVTSGGVSHTLTGTTTINGGTVSATNKDSNSSSVSYAVQNVSGTATITTPPTVIDKSKTQGTITWLP